MRIDKRMQGIQEAVTLLNEQLRRHLATYGNKTKQHDACLQKSESNRMIFALLVDDFGVKYFTKISADHLINVLKVKDEGLEVNQKGEKLCCMRINWHYKKRTFNISMPDYATMLLLCFYCPTPKNCNQIKLTPTPQIMEKVKNLKEIVIAKKLTSAQLKHM